MDNLVQLVKNVPPSFLSDCSLSLYEKGYKVENFHDPNEAYSALIKERRKGLVIVQPMIVFTPAPDSRYTQDNTDDFGKTGLVLLDDLINANPKKFPAQAVICSNVPYKTKLDSEIQEKADKLGITLWYDIQFDINGPTYVEKINNFVKQVAAYLNDQLSSQNRTSS